MNKDVWTDAVTSLDLDILAAYEQYRISGARAHKRKRRLGRFGAVAASLAVLIAAAAWLFAPMDLAEQNVLHVTFIRNGDYVMSYSYKDSPSRFTQWLLPSRRGEFYAENEHLRFYRLKGEGDVTRLIAERKDGTNGQQLITLDCFCAIYPFEERETVYPLPTIGEIFSMVYGVDGAMDLLRVTFEKGSAPHEIEAAVPVRTVTVTDADTLAYLYDLLAPVGYTEGLAVSEIDCNDSAYLDGKLPLTVQTMRVVTLEFVGGATCRFSLYATPDGFVIGDGLLGTGTYASLPAEAAPLLAIAAIDTTYRYWGTHRGDTPNGWFHDKPSGEVGTEEAIGETATPPPVPAGD